MKPTPFAFRPPVEGLTVVGEATLDAPPEAVELSFDIHSAGLSATVALQENAAKAKHIGQALAGIGNGQTEVKAGGVDVLPILQLPNPSSMMMPNTPLLAAAFGAPGAIAPMTPAVSENPSLVGFRAVSSIKVAVRDVNRIGEVVDIVTRSGATPNGSIRFLVQDEAALQRGLLEAAVREAREKAATLAGAVGKSTGTPISISEEFTAFQPHSLYGNGSHNPSLMHGQLTFCARVSVVYQLQ